MLGIGRHCLCGRVADQSWRSEHDRTGGVRRSGHLFGPNTRQLPRCGPAATWRLTAAKVVPSDGYSPMVTGEWSLRYSRVSRTNPVLMGRKWVRRAREVGTCPSRERHLTNCANLCSRCNPNSCGFGPRTELKFSSNRGRSGRVSRLWTSQGGQIQSTRHTKWLVKYFSASKLEGRRHTMARYFFTSESVSVKGTPDKVSDQVSGRRRGCHLRSGSRTPAWPAKLLCTTDRVVLAG